MSRIGAIVVPKDNDSRIDAEHALETSTWGSPDLRSHDDPEAPRKGDILLIARGFHGDAEKNIRVMPKATSFACLKLTSSAALAKNSVSEGSAPGQPPSM